ncbi:unnamed protein product [Closterium sp. NIES-53]
MASLRVLAFDHEGRPVQFDTWLDDLQLYLLRNSKDSVSLFDLASGAATAPPATADIEDLVSHLRTSDARYQAIVPAKFLERNQPPMFITLYFIVTRQCVPPDPGIAAAAQGASEFGTLFGTAPAQALNTFTLNSSASRCSFRDSTTLTPLPAPVPVRVADPSGGPVVARSSTVLPCPAVLSGSLSGLHLPSFSTNLPPLARVLLLFSARMQWHSVLPLRVPLPAPPESSLPEVLDPESDRTRTASPTVSRLLAIAVTDPSFESAAASALVAELLDFAAACRLDYATALFAESLSASPPSVGGECALRTDVLEDRVKRPPGSPPSFKARYVARGFSQRQGVDYFHTFSPTPKMTTLRVLLHVAAQRDYELHSLDFSTAFFLRRPVYGLRQAPCEWHDTLRPTLAALRFAPSTAELSLFLRTDTSLPPFYVLVYVDELVFAIADTEALTLVKSELQKRHTCTNLCPSALRLPVLLATAHSSVYRPLALSSTFGRVHRAEWSVPRACGLPHVPDDVHTT